MLVEEHYMGRSVCLDRRDNTAVRPSGCIFSTEIHKRGDSALSCFLQSQHLANMTNVWFPNLTSTLPQMSNHMHELYMKILSAMSSL